MDAVSNVRDLAHVAELLKGADRFAIIPHVAPDADAFGAACGLALLLKRLGKTVCVYSDEPLAPNYQFLSDMFPIGDGLPGPEWKLVFVDGGEKHRMPAPVRERPIWMNLDHHMGNGQFAEWIYVDTAAAATSLIVARLADPLGLSFDAEAASCLFTGLLFDTRGGFITDKCTPEVFEMVARLVAAGARPDHLNRLLNEQMTLGDFKLYGEALARIGTTSDGAVVYTHLTRAMVAETGGTDQAMEMLTLNLPKIAGGEIYVLFKETADGGVKLSFRSKGRLAVNTIAQRFNGGGHRFAAGGRVEGPIGEAISLVVAACAEAVAADAGVRP